MLNKNPAHCHNNDLHNPNAHWRVLFWVKLLKKVSEASGCWAASRLQHQGRSERVLPANCSSALTDRWVSPRGLNAQNNTRQNSCCTWSTHTHTHTHVYITTAIMWHTLEQKRNQAKTLSTFHGLWPNPLENANYVSSIISAKKTKSKPIQGLVIMNVARHHFPVAPALAEERPWWLRLS